MREKGTSKGLSKRLDNLEQHWARRPEWPEYENDMPIIVNENFENWNLNDWIVFPASETSGTFEISHGANHTGAHGARFYVSNVNRQAIYNIFAEQSEVTVEFWIRWNELYLGLSNEQIVFWMADADTLRIFHIELNRSATDGEYYFYIYSVGPSGFTKITTPIVEGKWYRLKCYFKSNDPNDIVKVWLDGNLKINLTEEISGGVGAAEYWFGCVLNLSSGDLTITDLDDIRIFQGFEP